MQNPAGFSLVEIVLALGVVAFAIVAILGVLPVGLQTSHGSQNDTRATLIAQAIFASLVSQARAQFDNMQLILADGSPLAFPLAQSSTISLYADNDGNLLRSRTNAAFAITGATNADPTGFDSGYANQVVLTIGWPATPVAAIQTRRDFVRIISKY
jgi:uncharacterized protein (TIGR02598 family)